MPDKAYKKRNAIALSPESAPSMENPLSGGMPSLVDGASRKDLPEAIRTKMENAFGADFSNLNIYESEKVAEGGARAVTQGNTIAFAPGEFNVYSPSSEALLGHELSHVVSQARGESRGSGLLTDSYLEAKADREGVMAAAGQQVYSGSITPLSNSTPMSVAGPMQCKTQAEKDYNNASKALKKEQKRLARKGNDSLSTNPTARFDFYQNWMNEKEKRAKEDRNKPSMQKERRNLFLAQSIFKDEILRANAGSGDKKSQIAKTFDQLRNEYGFTFLYPGWEKKIPQETRYFIAGYNPKPYKYDDDDDDVGEEGLEEFFQYD